MRANAINLGLSPTKLQAYDKLRARKLGRTAALRILGAEKSAAAKASWPQILLRMAIGDPVGFYNQLKNNKLLSPGGAWYDVVTGANVPPLARALHFALPAYSLYQAVRAPKNERGRAIGATVGGLAGSLAGAPLGILGNLAGGTVGSMVGQNIGGAFNQPEIPEP